MAHQCLYIYKWIIKIPTIVKRNNIIVPFVWPWNNNVHTVHHGVLFLIGLHLFQNSSIWRYHSWQWWRICSPNKQFSQKGKSSDFSTSIIAFGWVKDNQWTLPFRRNKFLPSHFQTIRHKGNLQNYSEQAEQPDIRIGYL